MTDMVYIASTTGIDFLDKNTIESKSLSLWVWPSYVLKVQIVCKTLMNIYTPKYKITNTSLYTNNICAERWK